MKPNEQGTFNKLGKKLALSRVVANSATDSLANGAQRSLENWVVNAPSFKFGSANINFRTYFRGFRDFLHPLNLEIYRILLSGRLMLIKDYYENCECLRGESNYIPVRK